MAYASKAGRARVSARNPQAQAVCQRCGIWYNRVDLKFQFEWRGAQLQNLYILVCEDCYDVPQSQLRAITLPADPTPIYYPSVEDFTQDETTYRATSAPTVYDKITGIPIPGNTLRITQDAQNRTINPFGKPVGLSQDAVMPYNGGVQMAFGVPLELLSVTADGSATVQVTCSRAHGFTANSQVSVEALADTAANGFYSVTVLSAMAFTYMTYGSIPAQGLLTPTTRIVTALVGLPLGYKRIPKIDGPPLNTGVIECFFETEDGTGMFLLENGAGFLALEQCTDIELFELESGTGNFLLENGMGFLELEDGP